MANVRIQSGQPRVLVIEDNEILRESVVDVLGFNGYEARGAEDGAEGLSLIEKFQPDLVVCDIMMPGIDGYGVLESVRANPSMATMPFIFLTALTSATDVRKGMESGAFDYLAKPFAMEELLATVRAQLKRRADYQQVVETRLNKLRNQMITSMPHELRTPLTAILGFSDLILQEGERVTPAQTIEYVEAINSAGRRLWHLVENYVLYLQMEVMENRPEMLNIWRSQSSKAPETSLEVIVNEIARRNKRENDLTLQIGATASSLAIGSENWKKLVDELVSNAFKFSRPGTPIGVTAEVTGPTYRVQISDKGRGMTREQIDSIGAMVQFDREKYEQQGGGLGLVISCKIVELHGGSFKLSSEPGSGTMISFELPFVSVPAEQMVG